MPNTRFDGNAARKIDPYESAFNHEAELRRLRLVEKGEKDIAKQYAKGAPMDVDDFSGFSGGSGTNMKNNILPFKKNSDEKKIESGEDSNTPSLNAPAERENENDNSYLSSKNAQRTANQSNATNSTNQDTDEERQSAEDEQGEQYRKQMYEGLTQANSTQSDNTQKSNGSAQEQKNDTQDNLSSDSESAAYAATLQEQKQQEKNQEQKTEEGEADDALGSNKPSKGTDIGLVGTISFIFLLVFHMLVDTIALFSGEISSMADWIFDLSLGIIVTIWLFTITGEIWGTRTYRKQATNVVKTIAEMIPGIGFLPLHTFTILFIFIDTKYDILNKVTSIKKNGKIVKKFLNKKK